MDSVAPLSAELRSQTPAAVLALLDHLWADNTRLTARVAQLEARLNQDSTNSSRPPSSDPPALKTRRTRRKPSGRNPGGQPGHPPHRRALLPVEQVTRLTILKPESCRHCRAPLRGVDPDPWRHQVSEIPAPRLETHEYQLHTLRCPQCGRTTSAPLPAGVPKGRFGPRIQAMVAMCGGCYRLSKRTSVELFADLFGVTLSLGSLSRLEEATSRALARPVAEAQQFVRTQANVFVDETGWREGNDPPKAWLWTAATSRVTVFVVARSRAAAVAQELVGRGFRGILHSDRWSAYNWLPDRLRQLCWAHLKRDFQAISERGGESARLGKRLVESTDQMFRWWHRVRDGTMAHWVFRIKMTEVRREVGALLRRGVACAEAETAGTCADILKRERALWSFVEREGVEPTNNWAELALRFAVVWRKGSFGTQGPFGSKFVARMLTVRATLRQQHRNVLEYLTEACRAALHSSPAPSLLPQAAPQKAAI